MDHIGGLRPQQADIIFSSSGVSCLCTTVCSIAVSKDAIVNVCTMCNTSDDWKMLMIGKRSTCRINSCKNDLQFMKIYWFSALTARAVLQHVSVSHRKEVGSDPGNNEKIEIRVLYH